MIYAGDQTPADLNTVPPDDIIRQAEGSLAPIKKAKSSKPAPICIVSGEELETERMLRFVIGPDDTLYPDFSENLPGPAFWCNLYRSTIEQAITQNAFATAYGKPVIIPENMMDTIDHGLRKQALAMISMAKKAGMLATGAEKAETMLRTGKAGIYLTAANKDADTRMKLTFLAKSCRIVDVFNSDELSTASGANKVVHAAMNRGGVAEKLFVHVKRLNLFQPKQEDRHD